MLVETLKNRLEKKNIKLNQWKMGYTDDEVEKTLPIFQQFLKDHQLKGKLYMVWENYHEEIEMPSGDSSLWIVENGRGYEIGVSPLQDGDFDRFIKSVLLFQKRRLILNKVNFESICGQYNAV